MQWPVQQKDTLDIDGVKLEAMAWGPSPQHAPTIILLHEGLGCVDLWRDFPQNLAEQTGYGVFAYSRAGYGQSDKVALPRPLDYMTREAVDVLPKVLDGIGFQRGVLLGHSDGATIAAIYTGSIEDFRVRGVILMASHFFTEKVGLDAIRATREAFASTDLRGKLARYHRDPDNAFHGWCDAWLDPGFASWNVEDVIAYLRVPVLAIQGIDDQYGTRAQIEALERGVYCPLDVEMLQDCKHSPHLEQQQSTLNIIHEYIKRLDRIEAAKVEVA